MRRNGSLIGSIMIVLGMCILLSILLPTCAWWFLFGAALVAAGIKLTRC